MDVNVRGAYLMFKAFGPEMVKQGGGVIINISSSAATGMWALRVSYGVSKAALNKLTTNLAHEMKDDKVYFVGIGLELPVLTEGFALVNPGQDTSQWEKPAIMGEAAVWVATHAEAYTGETLTIHQLREDYARGRPVAAS